MKKWQNYFFQEMRACARRRIFFSSCNQMMCKKSMLAPLEVNFFSGYYQKMGQGKFFKMVRITFEKCLWGTKKVKSNRLKSRCGWRKGKIIIFLQKMRACARRSNFFLVTNKKYGKKESLKLIKVKFENISLWSTTKK